MIASLFLPSSVGRFLSCLAVALLIAIGAVAPAAWAQDSNLKSLYDRVDRLQRDMNTLQRHIYRGETPPAELQTAPAGALPETQAARIEVKLKRMEDELRRLTGQLEEQNYRMGQVSERLDKLVIDVDERLQLLEQRALAGTPDGLAPEGAAAAVAGATVAGQAVAAADSAAPSLAAADYVAEDAAPEQKYERAFELLSQKNYDGAEKVLHAFLERHPDDKLAGNAKYWLGETFYVRGLYAEAAVTFAEGYQTYPESVKAPDNLLKLGKALAALGQKDDACGTFGELRKRYGNASSLIIQQAKNEQTRLACP